MKTYPFMQVDAFTTTALGGNPCAVFFDTADMSDETMLAVTREMNLSESAFVRPSANADFAVRYFTPMSEIPLAGHPTIATTYALANSGRLPITQERMTIQLELIIGPIDVEIYAPDLRVRFITMTQKKPLFKRQYSPEEVLPVFGLTEDDLVPNVPIQTVSTGTPQLMIAVKDLAVLKKINVNTLAYRKLHETSDWFSTHLFCTEGLSNVGQTFARHFSPPPDIFEDPFTGSATGGMAAFLYHYGLIDTKQFTAQQGHWMSRPGQAAVEVIGERDDIQCVKVGGPAVTVLTGTLQLP
ncbi:MAG: phenazine biosynthesis protein PhzF [Anaerolineaceae bacterium]|nr:phenazine biosynthesis protein PhzF [Anaerolineaceae bacterium]